MDNPAPAPDPELIYRLYTGGFRPQVVRIALSLDVFSPLAAGPAGAGDVARACGCAEDGTRLLLDHLVTLALLAREGEQYCLTPTAATFLVPGEPAYAGDWILAHTDPALWDGVLAALRGQRPDPPPFPWQQDAWLQIHRSGGPEAALALWRAAGIQPEAGVPFRLLDVGCGAAIKSLALARAHPQVEVTCLDRPAVLGVARHLADRLGLASRASFLAADLEHAALEPEAYDAVLLGYVTDYLRPPQNLSLLRRVHAALRPGGRLVVDVPLAAPGRNEFAATSALLAWALAGTRPYAFEDYQAWLAQAGYTEVRQVGAGWIVSKKI
ncbi:MAG: class I SAM-dependent methyltransferase [Anaerolineae bacterium]